jgi:hypothetical protein
MSGFLPEQSLGVNDTDWITAVLKHVEHCLDKVLILDDLAINQRFESNWNHGVTFQLLQVELKSYMRCHVLFCFQRHLLLLFRLLQWCFTFLLRDLSFIDWFPWFCTVLSLLLFLFFRSLRGWRIRFFNDGINLILDKFILLFFVSGKYFFREKVYILQSIFDKIVTILLQFLFFEFLPVWSVSI